MHLASGELIQVQVPVGCTAVDERLCRGLVPKLDETVPRRVALKENTRVRVCCLVDRDASLCIDVLGFDEQLVHNGSQLKVGALVRDREDGTEVVGPTRVLAKLDPGL